MRHWIWVPVCALVIFGCKREKPGCWTCNYTYSSSQRPDSTGDTVLCNFTKSDIELREDIDLGTTRAGYDTWRLTGCKQQ